LPFIQCFFILLKQASHGSWGSFSFWLPIKAYFWKANSMRNTLAKPTLTNKKVPLVMLIFQIAKLKKEGREALVIDVANHVMDNHIFLL
jgi:hypothetical protein